MEIQKETNAIKFKVINENLKYAILRYSSMKKTICSIMFLNIKAIYTSAFIQCVQVQF